jgi:UPF0716 protein FxsA
MFGILVFLFTVVPAVEIYFLFKIGGQIGGFYTMLIVLATGVVGASLAKSQGLSILMKIQNDVNKGSLPGNQIIHGLMVFAGGLLLLTPGFITDIFGFSLVMPGPRHILIIWVRKILEQAMKNGNLNFQTFSSGGGFHTRTNSFGNEQHNNNNNPFENLKNNQSNTTENKIDGDIIEAEFTRKD